MIISLGIGALPLSVIADICHARTLESLPPHTPRRLVTDSREVCKGDLFCALRGKDDGHRYIAEAQSRGACAVLAEKQTNAPLPHLLVPSVQDAIGAWAKNTANRPGLLRIGITGSVGKTTTKDALAEMLSDKFRVHATKGNFNNTLGLPFTLLSAPINSEICVCEIGISRKGEMRALSSILSPHISLITCIGHAHIGAFGTRDAIASEKRDILFSANENGLLFVPAHETLLSFVPPRGIRRIGVMPFDDALCQTYALPSLENDVPRAFSLAYCDAVAKELGFTQEERIRTLQRIFPYESRRKESKIGDLLLIEDGYNASPESVMSSLRYLCLKAQGRRIAVLGDMLELGAHSEQFHHAMGRYAAECADALFFFGAYASYYAAGACAGGASVFSSESTHFPCYRILSGTKEEMAKELACFLTGGDTVLFKASRALEVEKIADHLKQSKTKAGEAK